MSVPGISRGICLGVYLEMPQNTTKNPILLAPQKHEPEIPIKESLLEWAPILQLDSAGCSIMTCLCKKIIGQTHCCCKQCPFSEDLAS